MEYFKVLLHTSFPLPLQYTHKVCSTGIISPISEMKKYSYLDITSLTQGHMEG